MKAKLITKKDIRMLKAKHNIINLLSCSMWAEVDEDGREELFSIPEFCRMYHPREYHGFEE